MSERPGGGIAGHDTLRDRLRRETRALHQRAEAALAPEARLGSRAGYAGLLGGLLGLHGPLEAALARLDWTGTGIDVAARRKSGWILADLRDLGHAERSGPSPCPPRLGTRAEGLGALYVLEGSTLGGRILLGQAAASLGVSGAWGGRFLAGYGGRTGSMWRAFVTALNRVDPASPAADEAERAARLTFLAFEDWLCRTAPAPVRAAPAGACT